jgi:hypothetical protein
LQGLPDADVVRVLWVCVMRSVNLTGKNQAQNNGHFAVFSSVIQGLPDADVVRVL